MEIIKKRRSVRDYAAKPVESQKINELVQAVQLAPSACNSQPWRFIVTTNKVKEQIVNKGLGGLAVPNRWAKTAPVIMVACADLSLIPHRIGAKIKGIEYYMLDMGIAIEHLVLRATELGLGSCWIGWFNEGVIKRILRIPRRVKVVALIALGYPKEELIEHEKRRLEIDKLLYWNKWGAKEA
jgi:nitroreductase